MAKVICRICLRGDLQTRDIAETLTDFHDEIIDYAIDENNALKYCSVCEYLLLKFYKFYQKCKKANKILEYFKKNKKGTTKGLFPTNLHERLPPTSFGCSMPSTIQEFNLTDGKLEPMYRSIKQEKDNDNLDAIDVLQTDDVTQENFLESDMLDDSGDAKVFHVMEILNVDRNQSETAQESNKRLDVRSQSTVEEQKCEKQNKLKIKHEENFSDLEDNYFDEDSSESHLSSEFKKQIEGPSKPIKQRRKRRKPLTNLEEFETGFEIQLFATDQEAKEELEQRKHTEPYLSAEYKCGICNTVYKYRKMLDFHMRWHDPSTGDHECIICHMRFKTRIAVVRHKYSAHYGKFKCKNCPLVTYYKRVMATHYQYHAGTIFACNLCNQTFKHSSTYQTHRRMRHKTEHVCVTCAGTFVSKKGLSAHRSIVHNTKSLVDSEATAHCEPCGLTFANEQIYTVHIKNTDKHKDLASAIIACKLCGLRFENENGLIEHRHSEHSTYQLRPVKIKNALDKDAYKCTICGVVGTSRVWVYKHVEFAHPDSPYAADLKRRRQHMCDTCGKCYTTIYALRDHINIHTGAKPYACEKCAARFSCRPLLQIHKERHRTARRECPRCDKKFLTASNLSNHMRLHIQDRRYKCSMCHKGFLYSNALREHVRGVHHNVRRTRKLVKRETDAHES